MAHKSKEDEPKGGCSVLDETAAEAAEKRYFVETLRVNRRMAEEPQPLGPGQTHRVETGPDGRRVLRRKRFSAA